MSLTASSHADSRRPFDAFRNGSGRGLRSVPVTSSSFAALANSATVLLQLRALDVPTGACQRQRRWGRGSAPTTGPSCKQHAMHAPCVTSWIPLFLLNGKRHVLLSCWPGMARARSGVGARGSGGVRNVCDR